MTVIKPISVFAIILAVCAVTCVGQTAEELRTALRTGAAFSSEELAALDRGETIVKILAPADKREVAVCGAVLLQQAPELVAMHFHQSVTQNNKSVLVRGRFSDPPSLTDVQYLTVNDREIEDIRECVVGDCKLKLSAAMIDRFRAEIDWNRADYRTQVRNLFRTILVDYVRDYLLLGNSALIKYDDQDGQINVEQEQAALVEGAVIFNSLLPELKNELRNFAVPTNRTAQHSIGWAQVKFGLKPTVVITHTAKYIEMNRVVTVSRQIYASHYFDSSLVITGAFAASSAAKEPASYFIYTSYTRADGLDGSFGKLKRKLAESEAVQKVTGLLNQTRIDMAITAENELTREAGAASGRTLQSFFGGRRLLWWLAAPIVISLFMWLTRTLRVARARRLIGD